MRSGALSVSVRVSGGAPMALADRLLEGLARHGHGEDRVAVRRPSRVRVLSRGAARLLATRRAARSRCLQLALAVRGGNHT